MARRGSDDGSASAFSLPGSSRAAVGRARGGGGRGSAAAVSEEAVLALRDECQQVGLPMWVGQRLPQKKSPACMAV